MASKLIPAAETRIEMRVSNSRFIATAAPAFSVEEARDFISHVKEEFHDASHNVPAFIIGHGSSVISHCSDDGEPSGTAGRPALSVLQGSGLGDVVVVVTRYFGGTKLGTGGLVRAYGDAVRQVLAVMKKAEKVSTYRVSVTIPYSLFEQTRLMINALGGLIQDERFTADAAIEAQFRVDAYPRFQEVLRELTHGQISAKILEYSDATIMPIEVE
jgi:uncharacterized YigZ family protein